MKPSAATTVSAGSVSARAALDGDLDAGDPVVADEPGHLGVDDDLDRQRLHPGDGRGVRAELVPPVHQRHRLGQRLQGQRPVERRVAAADDDHVLAGQLVELRHEEDDAVAGELVRGRQRPGREAAQAAGDSTAPQRSCSPSARPSTGRPSA